MMMGKIAGSGCFRNANVLISWARIAPGIHWGGRYGDLRWHSRGRQFDPGQLHHPGLPI